MGHNVSIDDKNRIIIPKEYEKLDGKKIFYLYNPVKQVIGIYDEAQYEGAYMATMDDIRRSNKYTKAQIRAIQRTLTGRLISTPVKEEMDDRRRYVLDEEMLGKLGIEGMAYIEEVGEHIEVSKKR